MMLQLLPEFAALGALLILFFVTLGSNVSDRAARWITLALSGVWSLVAIATQDQSGLMFANSYKLDTYSQFFKILMAFGLMANALLGWPLRWVPGRSVANTISCSLRRVWR